MYWINLQAFRWWIFQIWIFDYRVSSMKVKTKCCWKNNNDHVYKREGKDQPTWRGGGGRDHLCGGKQRRSWGNVSFNLDSYYLMCVCVCVLVSNHPRRVIKPCMHPSPPAACSAACSTWSEGWRSRRIKPHTHTQGGGNRRKARRKENTMRMHRFIAPPPDRKNTAERRWRREELFIITSGHDGEGDVSLLRSSRTRLCSFDLIYAARTSLWEDEKQCGRKRPVRRTRSGRRRLGGSGRQIINF